MSPAMPNFPASWWGKLVDRYGLPLVLLAILAYALNDFGRWLAADVAAPVIKAHLETVQTLRETQQEIVRSQNQVALTIQQCCGGEPTQIRPAPSSAAPSGVPTAAPSSSNGAAVSRSP